MLEHIPTKFMMSVESNVDFHTKTTPVVMVIFHTQTTNPWKGEHLILWHQNYKRNHHKNNSNVESRFPTFLGLALLFAALPGISGIPHDAEKMMV